MVAMRKLAGGLAAIGLAGAAVGCGPVSGVGLAGLSRDPGDVAPETTARFSPATYPRETPAESGERGVQKVGSTAFQTHLVLPLDTDPRISQALEPHRVYSPSVRKGKLFLMLPGTGGTGVGLERVSETAATKGFHVLVLVYPNAESMGSLCHDDLGCYGKARQEVVLGTNSSRKVSVNVHDAISNRVEKALATLKKRYPREGWGEYLDRHGKTAWSRIKVGGLSQGGGHAAFIGKRFAVDRVLMFSSPADSDGRSPADWVRERGATSLDRYRGFAHVEDDGWKRNKIPTVWNYLNPTGGMTSHAQGRPRPRFYFNMITTNWKVANPHGSTANDRATPLNPNGVPEFRPVWEAMLED